MLYKVVKEILLVKWLSFKIAHELKDENLIR
jgi:hypothetical protein